MESKRIATLLKARFKAGGKVGEGKIWNLSLGGLFVGTQSIPPQGESVRVQFRLPEGHTVELAGLVWWTTATQARSGRRHRLPGFGLRLIDSPPAYEQAVRKLIEARSARI
jgi:uncharacterized protein (TIGR02266 family)